MRPEQQYNGLTFCELKQFLEEKYNQFNNPAFIPSDPISIPHRFTSKHDREISGFLVAAIAWGRRISSFEVEIYYWKPWIMLLTNSSFRPAMTTLKEYQVLYTVHSTVLIVAIS
jgi:hypothetical protein